MADFPEHMTVLVGAGTRLQLREHGGGRLAEAGVGRELEQLDLAWDAVLVHEQLQLREFTDRAELDKDFLRETAESLGAPAVEAGLRLGVALAPAADLLIYAVSQLVLTVKAYEVADRIVFILQGNRNSQSLTP